MRRVPAQLNPAKTTYVHRGVDLRRHAPVPRGAFEVWAPEEDTADYYGRFQPLDHGAVPAVAPAAGAAARAASRRTVRSAATAGRRRRRVPDLVESRREGVADNLLAIDKAANNTSVVFALEWRGWRLLFAGDAEKRSWKTMKARSVLKPVHFLKVSHHGSHNGTPADEIFDAILPGHSRQS